jgi:hypothetical protein
MAAGRDEALEAVPRGSQGIIDDSFAGRRTRCEGHFFDASSMAQRIGLVITVI